MRAALFAAAVTIAFGAGGAHAANLIQDGNFNNSNSGFQTIYAPAAIPNNDGSDSAWTVTTGSVDLIGGYWQSPSGPNAAQGGTNGSVDLDGNSQGAISQTISNMAAGKYRLTFDLSGNPDSGPQTVQVSTSETGAPDPVYSYNVTNMNSHSMMNYTSESETFFASGPTTITFASDTPGAYGPVIGNVAVSAVPEASTWVLMIAGIGGIGLALRRSKRQAGFKFGGAITA